MARIKEYDLYIDNARLAEADFDDTAAATSTSVSSVAWSVPDGTTVTISNESTSSNVSTALISASTSTGCSLVRALATMANSEKHSIYFKFNVIEPEC